MLITLNCLVVSEDPYENAFNVDIDFSKTIDHLRKIIKERINVPNNVKAKDLKLWMVDIPFDEKNDKMDILSTKSKPNIKVDLNGIELKPLSKTKKHFSNEPHKDKIHIIIEQPVESKEVYCIATYGRKMENFQWIITQNMVILSGLKAHILHFLMVPKRNTSL
ncbi:17928_t:CDS:1 [Funneliformis geosporum]|nr:17928_t:CDS:1 [Funneliformis geosporum]